MNFCVQKLEEGVFAKPKIDLTSYGYTLWYLINKEKQKEKNERKQTNIN